MRFIFVHHVIEDRGSAQDMYHYVKTAEALGHEVVLYGRPQSDSVFKYSQEVRPSDVVVFIFEWTTELQYGTRMDWTKLVTTVPRERRIVLDCDGKYNDAIEVVGDHNHSSKDQSRRWIEVCDSLSDKIFQPSLHPLRSNVRTFFFHAYDPKWEVPLDFHNKSYGMIYVGNNWFRWRALQRMLQAVEPIRDQVGGIRLVGNGWDTPPPWANPTISEEAYQSDLTYLESLHVETSPPIRFDQVIPEMSKGIFSPVIYRPLFDRLQFITCRTFETPAANVIPLFGQQPEFVTEIYGEDAVELVLPKDKSGDKILDILRRPDYYATIVSGIRQQMAAKHSYAVRLRELIRIVES